MHTILVHYVIGPKERVLLLGKFVVNGDKGLEGRIRNNGAKMQHFPYLPQQYCLMVKLYFMTVPRL